MADVVFGEFVVGAMDDVFWHGSLGRFGRTRMPAEPFKAFTYTNGAYYNKYILETYGFGFPFRCANNSECVHEYERNVLLFMAMLVRMATDAVRKCLSTATCYKSVYNLPIMLPTLGKRIYYPISCYCLEAFYNMQNMNAPYHRAELGMYTIRDHHIFMKKPRMLFSAQSPGTYRQAHVIPLIENAEVLEPVDEYGSNYFYIPVGRDKMVENKEFMSVPVMTVVGRPRSVWHSNLWEYDTALAYAALMGFHIMRMKPSLKHISHPEYLTLGIATNNDYVMLWSTDYIDIIVPMNAIPPTRAAHYGVDDYVIRIVNRWYRDGRMELRLRCKMNYKKNTNYLSSVDPFLERVRYFDLVVTDPTKPLVLPGRSLLAKIFETNTWDEIEWIYKDSNIHIDNVMTTVILD